MSMELQDSTVVRRGDGWLSAWVGEEHVMMSADTGTCISLSETGGRIWELIEQPVSLSNLCDTLAGEYEVAADTLRADVVHFLQTMQVQHAITAN